MMVQVVLSTLMLSASHTDGLFERPETVHHAYLSIYPHVSWLYILV